VQLCSIVTGGRTLLQHCSSCTDCPSSTASSSRSRRWFTTFYIMDVRRFSSTWLHSTWQTLIDGNSGRRIPKQPSWNGHGPNSVNAPSLLVVPTYETVFLQQSATLTVIQHWSHIYYTVLLWHNFLSLLFTIDYCNAQSAFFTLYDWALTLFYHLSFIIIIKSL